MESGINNVQPLLSIAIPTWNRAKKLEIALERILPTLGNYGSQVQLVISDNASTDNTQAIISRLVEKYQTAQIVSFKQNENIGFYGNFKKCFSLGTGKFFWLLSDDDFIFDGLIETVIEILTTYHTIGAIFLSDWTDDGNLKEKHTYNLVNHDDFFKFGNIRHTLISSVIYAHNVKGDDEIFSDIKNNSLIGYPVFLKAVNGYNDFAILRGNSLLKTNTEVRFDALNIFTVELAICLRYAKRYLPNHIIQFITNRFIATLISKHYRDHKYHGLYKTSENNSLSIFKHYVKFRNFWIYIVPVILMNKSTFYKLKRVFKFNK